MSLAPLLVIASCGLVGAGLALFLQAGPQSRLPTSASQAADPLRVLDEGQWQLTLNAMLEQYAEDKPNGFNPAKVDSFAMHRRQQVPDLGLVNPDRHKIGFVYLGGSGVSPKEVALISDLYATSVHTLSKDGTTEGSVMHHGFYLVVYKNGDWEKVPVGKVRYVPLPRTDSTGFEVDYRFPKMKGY